MLICLLVDLGDYGFVHRLPAYVSECDRKYFHMSESSEAYAVSKVYTYPVYKISHGPEAITFLSSMSVSMTCHAFVFVKAKFRTLKRKLISIELLSKHQTNKKEE